VPSDGGNGGRSVDRNAAETSTVSSALLAIGIVVAVVVLDQITKVWAVASLSDGPVSIVGSSIELELTRNPGGAFSLFQSVTPLLALLALVVAVVLARAIVRTNDRIMLVALSLVLGGALGNLIDRVARAPGFLRGEVVDFVSVGTFPTFNVADSAITIGALLLVVCAWRQPRPRAG
jgi:signal peptidase II